MVADDTQLYLVQFYHLATGARVVALDLRTGQQNWGVHVRGLGPVYHSRYSNDVSAALISGALVVFGKEAAGSYVEVFGPQGEMLSSAVRQ